MGGCISDSDSKKKKSTQEFQAPQIIIDLKTICKKCLNLSQMELDKQLYSVTSIKHSSFEQINKDIDRTFPNQDFFRKQSNRHRFKMLLYRFALNFPSVGYTQGINFVGGYVLLNQFNDVDALKMMISLASHKDLLLIGLYEDQFPLCQLYCEIFWSVIRQKSPKLYKKLKQFAIPDQMWLFQWFICLFIYSFPLGYVKDFFRFIIIRKQLACVKLALAIIFSLESRILNLRNQDQFIQCLQHMKNAESCRKILKVDKILKQAQKISSSFVLKYLEKTTLTNWYKLYFSSKDVHKSQKYNIFLQQLDKQRIGLKNVFLSGMTNKTHAFSRVQSSMTIIDFIQQKKAKRYSSKYVDMTHSAEVAYKNSVVFSGLNLQRFKSQLYTLEEEASKSQVQQLKFDQE